MTGSSAGEEEECRRHHQILPKRTWLARRLPQAVDSARQNKTRIKDAVFTLVSIAPQKRVFR